MIYGAILAGGKGTRMGVTNMPKQFLMLGKKPIIIHTLEQFLINPKIDLVLVLVPKEWLSHTKDIVKKYIKENSKIEVIEGGESRNETILRGCQYAKEHSKDKSDNLIVTHDAVRPFISQRILDENIEQGLKNDAVDTVIPSADTIVESKDGQYISNIPVRSEYFLGQTPQTFSVDGFIELYNGLTDEEKEILTDACKIFVIRGKKVGLVQGEIYNMKITKIEDLEIAKAILTKENHD